MTAEARKYCSWPIASLLFLLLLINPFILTLLPSFGYSFLYRHINLKQKAAIPCSHETNSSMDQTHTVKNFPVEPDQVPVYYRDAPWRPKIGEWLSSCDAVSSHVDVAEGFFSSSCKDDCNGNGVCNQELRKCRCRLGYTGEACEKHVESECNLPSTKEDPYGALTSKICPAYCEKSRAFCFCGEGTKYPNRPVSDICGFQNVITPVVEFNSVIYKANYSSIDLDIYTSNKSEPGWCNVDPEEGYANITSYKKTCNCPYDGSMGKFCEIPTVSTCIHQCSGHGHCHGGFCQCEEGWYGVDCSIPSAYTPTQEWPQWLSSSNITTYENKPQAIVKKTRPLIYIYDLPYELNIQIIEGRDSKEFCVNRRYDENNRTTWTGFLYGSQLALMESLHASHHRTLNAKEADYFVVPIFDDCFFRVGEDAQHYSMQAQGPLRLRNYVVMEYLRRTYSHIMESYPYWNRSSGRDHIWFLSNDEGACFAPKEIQESIFLTHWGNTNSMHNYSTTGLGYVNWNTVSASLTGNHVCFNVEKDIVVPSWKKPDPVDLREARWRRPRKERKNFFYFRGNLGEGFPGFDCYFGTNYSMGIRQKVGKQFSSMHDLQGMQHSEDVIVACGRSSNYHDDLSRSVFCGALPGHGWSGRIEDSILHGCIPVIVQDGIMMPFENVLHYESFSVRIKERDIPNMINILREINETVIESMLKNVQSIWTRFVYRDAIMFEAERQERLFGDMKEWGIEYSKIVEDDVISTIFQVLHYKLHNDPWRKQVDLKHKEYGLPQSCLQGDIND